LRYWIACLLIVPLFELAAHALIVARVPAPSEYRAAADFIRARLKPRDLVTAAPTFIDPILRWQLGDRMPLSMAGRSDDAGYDRMWVMSIRDALPADAPRHAPELTQTFGRVRVLRFRLPHADSVLFDFVEHWSEAQASITRGGREQACPLRVGGMPRGGGLGRGVLMPVHKRFECDARAASPLFMADVVLEGLDNEPHHCIWQHAQGDEPVTLSFPAVPLGRELWFYGGLYYEHERMREGAPIDVSIAIDGQERAQFRHLDGEGFRGIQIATQDLGKSPASVSVAVRSSNPQARSFCWTAQTRGPLGLLAPLAPQPSDTPRDD